MTKLARSFLVVLAVAGAAQADVWKRASDPDPQLDFYEALMAKGDEAAIAANAQSINLKTVLAMVDKAIEAYRGAAKARPKSPEPYFRIASVLHSFFIDCSDFYRHKVTPSTCHMPQPTIDRRARETLEAWEKFEALAPLDPRVNEILLARALTRTKLVGTSSKPDDLLRGAASDYQNLLDREDGLYGANELALGNLAETHMMLGDTEKAIDLYKEAWRAGGGTSTIYGLAVALDRDGQGEAALRVMRDQGIDALFEFERRILQKQIFFVPAGEEDYYFALAHEAFGNIDEAIAHWRSFIRSRAHPKFEPRAKEHLDKLLAGKPLRLRPPILQDLEDPPRIPRLRKPRS